MTIILGTLGAGAKSYLIKIARTSGHTIGGSTPSAATASTLTIMAATHRLCFGSKPRVNSETQFAASLKGLMLIRHSFLAISFPYPSWNKIQSLLFRVFGSLAVIVKLN